MAIDCSIFVVKTDLVKATFSTESLTKSWMTQLTLHVLQGHPQYVTCSGETGNKSERLVSDFIQ